MIVCTKNLAKERGIGPFYRYPNCNQGNPEKREKEIPKNVGKVTQVDLPLESMPSIDGNMEIGIAAVDDVGNMSDIVSGIFPFDFQAPSPPGMPFLI